MKHLFLIIIAICFSSLSYAANPGAGFTPKGISGSAGVGFALFDITSPKEEFKLDQGMFASLGIEKGLDIWNFYITFGLSYLTTEGQVHYKYATLSGESYDYTDVNLKMDIFQASLGIKFKIIDGYWLRPYIEGGGQGGYYQLKYQNLTQKVDPSDPKNYKTSDSLIDFGQYAEAGSEFTFSDSFGVKLAARVIVAQTKKFETLNKQNLTYQSQVYYLSLLKAF